VPIFEYKCSGCGKTFEKLVRSETAIACMECGSKDVIKLFSTFAAHVGSSTGSQPSCAPECGDGFTGGKCGSGMCGHHHH
jgi:putative FmdB family regulatory protein